MTSPSAYRAANAAKAAAPNSQPPLAPAAPPSPKQQAVTFALELAKVRATGGVPGERATTADQLIADAKTIAAYLGQS